MSQELEQIEPVCPVEFYGDERETFDRIAGGARREHSWAMHYFRLGKKRTYKETASYFEIPRERIQLTAAKHSWVMRARAFDDYEEARRAADLDGAQLQTRESHLELMRDVRAKVEAKIASMDLFAMSPRDIPAYLDAIIKWERLTVGLGDAPKKIEITGKDGGAIEVANMTAEERRQMLEDLKAEIVNRQRQIEAASDVIEGEIVSEDDAS